MDGWGPDVGDDGVNPRRNRLNLGLEEAAPEDMLVVESADEREISLWLFGEFDRVLDDPRLGVSTLVACCNIPHPGLRDLGVNVVRSRLIDFGTGASFGLAGAELDLTLGTGVEI